MTDGSPPPRTRALPHAQDTVRRRRRHSPAGFRPRVSPALRLIPLPPYHVRAALHQLPLVISRSGSLSSSSVSTPSSGSTSACPRRWPSPEAVLASSVVLLALRLGLPTRAAGLLRIPLSVTLVNAVLAFAASSACARSAGSRGRPARSAGASAKAAQSPRPAVLLIGAGAAGVMAVREIRSRGELELDVRGFVDDDPLKRGAVIAGIRVLGAADELPGWYAPTASTTSSSPSPKRPASGSRGSSRSARACRSGRRRSRRFYDLLQGRGLPQPLPRRSHRGPPSARRGPPRPRPTSRRSSTGAPRWSPEQEGRSAPSWRGRFARFAPRRLLFGRAGGVCAVRDRPRARFGSAPRARDRSSGRRHRRPVSDESDIPPIPAGADRAPPAAHKHVPLMEDNACEAVGNNVFGTLNLGEVAGGARRRDVRDDLHRQAVRPSSIMGASKRVAELVVQELGRPLRDAYVARCASAT